MVTITYNINGVAAAITAIPLDRINIYLMMFSILGLYSHISNFTIKSLRSMSSMSEEEKEEYCNLQDKFLYSSQYPVTDACELFDWLNAHSFDYRQKEYF